MVVNGMGIQESGGNVVTNDLHYSSCLYNYKMRQQRGLDVRIVKHRDWRLDPADFEKVIDDKTKLVALTLVSNVNGLLAPVKEIAGIAHRNGAYGLRRHHPGLWSRAHRCAGHGIDFAACSTYKWLMGLRGFAYLYIKEDLQETVVQPGAVRRRRELQLRALGRKSRLRQGRDRLPAEAERLHSTKWATCRVSDAFANRRPLNFIHRVGVDEIQAHVAPLTGFLQEEMPKIGVRFDHPEWQSKPDHDLSRP